MNFNGLGLGLGLVLAVLPGVAVAQVAASAAPEGSASAVSGAATDLEDTPEEIAKDAARDLKDSSFYNKPGATRAQYDADWQACRLIARGSRTPGGTVVYTYNPNVISPFAAGIGAGIGGLIGNAIVEGHQRRMNRRACLMYRGWRRVEVSEAEAKRVAAMTDADRDAYFNALVGAEQVAGEVTELTSFSLASDPVLRLDAPLVGAPTLAVARKTDDPRAAITLAEGEGALVVAFARPDAASAGRSGQVQLLRYDGEKRDIAYQPRDWKKRGDLTTYARTISSKDRKAPYELHVIKLTAGRYVVGAAAAGLAPLLETNCFGAPIISVPAGKVVYAGDWIPFMDVTLSTGKKLISAMGWVPHLDRARTALAEFQPALAGMMEMAEIRNGATYSCAGVTMSKWELPGQPQMEAAAATDGAIASK